ncbi:HET-domain-containing protein [Sporormia fimetaria CBS 119925]|uniref:HET-domain-containing protein n=1 Tax=Sporormia fimetaria CBS 119925 TaxID=1340428 RepID=A0A6A6VIL8_9PLEO|nr:HET-domain-containing protein [Sporormia fimetaria CBS 119925]
MDTITGVDWNLLQSIVEPPRPAPHICAECQPIVDSFDLAATQRLQYPHHKTLRALKASASAGCRICATFANGGITAGAVRNLVDERLPDGNLAVWNNTASLKMAYETGDLSADDDALHQRQPSFLSVKVRILPTATQIPDYNSPSPTTADALPLCKAWFQRCYNKHPGCNPPSPRFTPTRLIYVGDSTPRLCLSKDLNGPVRFAALSHCWGKLKFQTLTQGTLLDFIRLGLPPASLHKTFHEAIYICRYLGIDYIWIDSLCIIQDSDDDWKRESALMSEVYGGCDLNIAATAAADGNDGCFFSRPRDWLCQVSTQSANGNTAVYNILPTRWAEPKRNALGSRAWVVQERYLSRRTLHFTATQVFWECDQRICCEAFPIENLQSRRLAPFFFHMSRRPLSREIWPDLLQHYSSCDLSFANNRLVAIAGLAKAIAAITQEEYISGIWRSELENPVKLAWEPLGLCTAIPDSTSPTWSWGSVMGPVDLPCEENFNYIAHPLVHLHSLHYDPNTVNPFADVTNAVLRLTCTTLYHARLTYAWGREGTMELLTNSQLVVPLAASGGLDCVDTSTGVYSIQVFVLPLGVANSAFLTSLILARPSSVKGRFERVGLVHCRDFRGEVAGEDNILCVGGDCVSGVVGDGRYVIELV